MAPTQHALKSYNDDADAAELEVRLETYQIEVNVTGDQTRQHCGGEVMDGYTRTVRIEWHQDTLKVHIYGVNSDDPLTIEVPFEQPPVVTA